MIDALYDYNPAAKGLARASREFVEQTPARKFTGARWLAPVDISGLGERAMARLLDAMQRSGGGEPRQETLATTLIVRGSCGGGGIGAAAAGSDSHRPLELTPDRAVLPREVGEGVAQSVG